MENAHEPAQAPDLLTLRQLELLSVAGSSNSFSAAARKLGISQPTLSAAIARIEQQLQARLFDRSSRSSVLTPEGESFTVIATELVASYRAGSRRLRARTDELHNRVVLATLPSIAASIVPGALAAFLKDHPDTAAILHDMGRKQALEMVLDRVADFAIVADPPDLPELRSQPLCRDQFMVVAPSAWPIAQQSIATWNDLHSIDFALVGTRAARAQIEQAWIQEGHRLEPRFSVEQVSTALALAVAGLCCTLLPKLYLTPELLGGLRAIPLQAAALDRSIQLVHRGDRPLNPLSQDLQSRLQQSALEFG